jgi:DNA-binding GntR family transcriptional regulator
MDAKTGNKSEPAAERAYRHIKRALMEQEYAGGTLLTEGEIAAAVGLSRTPVREALLRLEAEGLLRLYPKKGALVLPLSAQEIDDVFEARELVETFAAGKAWPRRADLVAKLEPLLAAMDAHQRSGDARAFMAADRAFHAAVVGAAGNAVLDKLYASLRDRQMCMGVAALRISPERVLRAAREHAAMVDALRGDDRDEADADDGDVRARFRALVRDHVTGAAEHLRASR